MPLVTPRRQPFKIHLFTKKELRTLKAAKFRQNNCNLLYKYEQKQPMIYMMHKSEFGLPSGTKEQSL